MMMEDKEIKPPPPIPAIALKIISQIMFFDNPHPVDPNKNIIMAVINVHFLPNISLTFPYTG